MKICIVAAGLATRLQPLTNYIPKFLINIGKQTGFVEMIRYWSEHTNDFTIIVHPKYEELTRAYFNMYFGKEINLTIKTIDTALGTAHTIDTSISNSMDGEDVLFTWCDVIPSNKIRTHDLQRAGYSINTKTVILTVDNQKNRYKVYKDTLVKCEDASGDVIGIYYVPNYKSILGQYTEGQDFADVLANQKNLVKYELDDIIDFGDKEKLYEVLKMADEGREFNSITMLENYVHKKALNKQGVNLLYKEFLWYKEIHDNEVKVNVPKVYLPFAADEMIMERVDGVSMYKVFSKLDDRQQMELLANVDKQLELLASEVEMEIDNSVVLMDVKKEAHEKLLNRYYEIKPMIDAFGTGIKVVNGLPINTDVAIVICSLFVELSKHYKDTETYQLIHGDLQMSNTMVNPRSLKVTLIDPRGYFGNTQLYGLQDYDKAKMLYSLSGYDLLNYSSDFHIKNITSDEIEFDIPSPINTKYGPTMLSKYEPVHWLWLAVIWLGLGQYIRNNPVKSLAAHYHGLYLATKVLNKDYTL